MTRLLLVLLPALLAPLMATAANAYPVGSGHLILISGTLGSNQTVVVEGTGFAPGASVSFDVASDPTHLATVTADASGTVEPTLTLPTLAPGTHVLSATGVDAAGTTVTLALSFDVTASASPTSPGGLPVTGSDWFAPVATTGGIALLLGGGLLLVSLIRRRRADHGA